MAGATWNDPIEIQISDDGGDFVSGVIDVSGNHLETDDLNYPNENIRISWWRYTPAVDGTVTFDATWPSGGSLAVYRAPVDVASKAATHGSGLPITDFAWADSPAGHIGATFTAEVGSTYIWEIQSAFLGEQPKTIEMIITGAPASLDYGPTVVLDPWSKTVTEGDTVSMSSLGYGRPMPTLQWQKDHVPEFVGPHDWQDIPGATSSPFFFVADIDDNAMRWRAKWTSRRGTVYSEPATLTVRAATPSNRGDVVLPPSSGAPAPDPSLPDPGTGSPLPPSADPLPPGTGSASLLALIREFSSTVKRAVRITGPASIEMVDPAAPLPSGWSQSEAAELYSSTTRDLKAGMPQLSMRPEDLALLVVGATFKTNDARLLTSGWRLPDPLPVYGLTSPAPVQRVSYSFSPQSFQASIEFFVSDVPDNLRRH